MLLLVFLLITFASYKVFLKFKYQSLRAYFQKVYVVPPRFYLYFLFFLGLISFLISVLAFSSFNLEIIAFLVIYLTFFLGFYTFGFKAINFLIIRIVEYCIKMNLLLFSIISMVAIVLIFYSILINSVSFFSEVGLSNFLFKTVWNPENYEVDLQNSFGIIPLLINTFYIMIFGVFVAFFFGMFIAIYLSEYIKNRRVAFFLKSSFEIVAGIPSIFYGFFGAFLLAPKMVSAFASVGLELSAESILIPSIAVGLMMIPYVATLLDDAFSSVPKTLKDSAIAMGLTRFETIFKLIIPVSSGEILSTLIIVISRILGETMVVLLTCGIIAKMSFNPLDPSTTMTVQIVHLLTGDTSFETAKTLSVFGLSLFLFIATLALNILQIRIKNKS